MIAIVTRQKSDPLPLQRSEQICIRRLTEGSLQFDFLDVRKAVHLIQTAAANDSNSGFSRHVRLTPLTPRVLQKDE